MFYFLYHKICIEAGSAQLDAMIPCTGPDWNDFSSVSAGEFYC